MHHDMAFTKLHATIIHSSIWQEPPVTRVVWVTMLAMADANGIVHASVSGLARAANVTRKDCQDALASFLGPDPDSRDKTTGERIEEIDGGWFIINHAKYRDKQSREQEMAAIRAQRYRDKRSVTHNEITPNHGRHEVRSVLSGTSTDGTVQPVQKKIARHAVTLVTRPADVSERVWDAFLEVRKRKRAPLTELAWEGIVREAKLAAAVDSKWTLEEVLRKCVERTWQSFEASWIKGDKANGKSSSIVPKSLPLSYYQEGREPGDGNVGQI